mmetsp:Transcript_33918/g.66757  ORF Transcript_33918/g.66757 Transcript_33918/m.66757 type:complete len:250 (-) Transcript_33918:1701-2450(-)
MALVSNLQVIGSLQPVGEKGAAVGGSNFVAARGEGYGCGVVARVDTKAAQVGHRALDSVGDVVLLHIHQDQFSIGVVLAVSYTSHYSQVQLEHVNGPIGDSHSGEDGINRHRHVHICGGDMQTLWHHHKRRNTQLLLVEEIEEACAPHMLAHLRCLHSRDQHGQRGGNWGMDKGDGRGWGSQRDSRSRGEKQRERGGQRRVLPEHSGVASGVNHQPQTRVSSVALNLAHTPANFALDHHSQLRDVLRGS